VLAKESTKITLILEAKTIGDLLDACVGVDLLALGFDEHTLVDQIDARFSQAFAGEPGKLTRADA
jgi:hypothetical protein